MHRGGRTPHPRKKAGGPRIKQKKIRLLFVFSASILRAADLPDPRAAAGSACAPRRARLPPWPPPRAGRRSHRPAPSRRPSPSSLYARLNLPRLPQAWTRRARRPQAPRHRRELHPRGPALPLLSHRHGREDPVPARPDPVLRRLPAEPTATAAERRQADLVGLVGRWRRTEGMDAVKRLKSGFEQFKTEVYDKKPELFEPLKAGQAPRYMVFACADSRCCPSVTLGLQPGEAFTIRNIAAMVPPYDKNRYTGIGSAIEYAVCALKVQVLVVIGHSKCGGIKALLSLQDGAADSFHFVEDWVRIGFQAKKKVQTENPTVPFDDQCSILEKEAVNVSLENLLTYPWVKEGVANGTLNLVGGHYNFVDGEFLTWEK